MEQPALHSIIGVRFLRVAKLVVRLLRLRAAAAAAGRGAIRIGKRARSPSRAASPRSGDLVVQAYERRSGELAAREAIYLLRHENCERFLKDAGPMRELAALAEAIDADEASQRHLAALDEIWAMAFERNPKGSSTYYRLLERPMSIATTAVMFLYH
eukprot:tig00020960_g16598.t1